MTAEPELATPAQVKATTAAAATTTTTRRKAKIISIVSGKGGVGKTTLTSNLGVLLSSEFHKKVLLVDGNISTANLGIHLGFIKCPVAVQDVIDKTIKTYQAIYVHRSGLHIIPASLSMEHEQHDYAAKTLASRISRIISDVRHEYDLILIDGAAGIGGEAKAAIAASDISIVITVPEIPTVTAAIKVVETSKELEIPVFGIVLNRVRGGKIEVPKDEVERLCGARIVTTIPEDEAVRESTSHREPVSMLKPNAASVNEIRKLAKLLIAEEPPSELLVKASPEPHWEPRWNPSAEEERKKKKEDEEKKRKDAEAAKKREREEEKKKKEFAAEEERKRKEAEEKKKKEEEKKKREETRKPGLFRNLVSILPFSRKNATSQQQQQQEKPQTKKTAEEKSRKNVPQTKK
ncbi:MAG: AAA family ATPase [archaeon]